MKIEIKPCPFCGKATKWINLPHRTYGGFYSVFCAGPNCAVEGPRRKTERGAIKAWNKAWENVK